jgi:hypothetical protein
MVIHKTNFFGDKMNIEDLTVKQVKEINALTFFGIENKKHPFVGKYCIARCYAAGVHAGYVVEVIDKDSVILKDSRRLHSWKGTGIALSGVANGELLPGERVDTINPEIYLSGVCELIPCSEKARISIHESK